MFFSQCFVGEDKLAFYMIFVFFLEDGAVVL